jgi:hypothetical protein
MNSRDKSMTNIKITKTFCNFIKSTVKQYFTPIIVLSLLLISKGIAAQQTTIQEALKDVGINKLPSFIVVSDNAVGLHFPAKFGGHKLTFAGSVDADALKDKKFVFTSSEKGKIDWKNAFGMSMLELSDLGLSLTIDSEDIAITLSGELGGVFKKKNDNIDVNIDIALEDKEISDFTLALTGHRFSLADFKEF